MGNTLNFLAVSLFFKHSDKIISEKGSQNAKNRTDIISNASKFADWLLRLAPDYNQSRYLAPEWRYRLFSAPSLALCQRLKTFTLHKKFNRTPMMPAAVTIICRSVLAPLILYLILLLLCSTCEVILKYQISVLSTSLQQSGLETKFSWMLASDVRRNLITHNTGET